MSFGEWINSVAISLNADYDWKSLQHFLLLGDTAPELMNLALCLWQEGRTPDDAAWIIDKKA